MRRTPIRTRLTAWYALVLAAVLVALGAFVVTRLGADLTAELDRSLRASADQIALGYHAEGPAEFHDVTRTVLPVPGERGAGAQVLGRDGRVVLAEGDRVTGAPLLDPPALARVLAGGRVTTSRRAGRPALAVRVTALPVRRDGEVRALVAAESLAEVDSARHRVLVLLLVGGTAGLALAALGGWTIARRAMRPVERMTSRADEVGRGDLRQRIAVPRVEDEVGHLARTLNAMLDRLEAGVEARERLVATPRTSCARRWPPCARSSTWPRHDALDAAARRCSPASATRSSGRAARWTYLPRGPRRRRRAGGCWRRPEDVGPPARRRPRAAAAAGARSGSTSRACPASSRSTASLLPRVVGHLLDNAIRSAVPRGEVRVVLGVRGGEGGVTVLDDGPGVLPQRATRLRAPLRAATRPGPAGRRGPRAATAARSSARTAAASGSRTPSRVEAPSSTRRRSPRRARGGETQAGRKGVGGRPASACVHWSAVGRR